jgi:hypothetical protein
MPWTSLTPIYVWAGIFIPAFVLLMIFPPKVKLTAILAGLAYLSSSLIFVMVVNWSLINYWLRFLPLFLTFVLILRFWRANRTRFIFELDKIWRSPFLPKGNLPILALAAGILILLASLFVNLRVFQSYSIKNYPGKPVLLFFPLRYGFYVVVNGGDGLNGIGMNDSYQNMFGAKTGNASLGYVVDFMRLINNRGQTSKGILPSRRQDYESYSDKVYAPCFGTVAYVEDGHPDSLFGTPEAPLGNRVVLQCFEYYVTIANLRKDSIIVKVGDNINYLMQIGLVGSSGTPNIPHLRVFTTTGSWDENGTPVPQIFDIYSRFLVRNDLLLPGY